MPIARSGIPGKIKNTTGYQIAGPLGLSKVKNYLRIPGVLAYALERTQAGQSTKRLIIMMTVAPRSIFCTFQL